MCLKLVVFHMCHVTNDNPSIQIKVNRMMKIGELI